MPTRRAIVLGTIATGIAMQTARARANASQPATPVNFDVPAGACDCHTHIFGAAEQFPFFPGRVYTPEPALPDEMAALHRSLRIERVVFVTPSVYGTDNGATIYGIRARGASARGVAVIDEKTSESDLEINTVPACAASGSIWQPAASAIRRWRERACKPPLAGPSAATGTSRFIRT
jgi:hypothetical protein